MTLPSIFDGLRENADAEIEPFPWSRSPDSPRTADEMHRAATIGDAPRHVIRALAREVFNLRAVGRAQRSKDRSLIARMAGNICASFDINRVKEEDAPVLASTCVALAIAIISATDQQLAAPLAAEET